MDVYFSNANSKISVKKVSWAYHSTSSWLAEGQFLSGVNNAGQRGPQCGAGEDIGTLNVVQCLSAATYWTHLEYTDSSVTIHSFTIHYQAPSMFTNVTL